MELSHSACYLLFETTKPPHCLHDEAVHDCLSFNYVLEPVQSCSEELLFLL